MEGHFLISPISCCSLHTDGWFAQWRFAQWSKNLESGVVYLYTRTCIPMYTLSDVEVFHFTKSSYIRFCHSAWKHVKGWLPCVSTPGPQATFSWPALVVYSLLQTIQETRKNFHIFQQFNMYKSQKMVINNSKYYLRKIALETDQMTGVKGQGHWWVGLLQWGPSMIKQLK